MKSVNELPFYNYSSSSITTNLTHYGSYRTVEPFDPPTQNTINIYAVVFKGLIVRGR